MAVNKRDDLIAKLNATQHRISRDREHAQQIADPKIRAEVELYLERVAEALAAEIAVLKTARNEASSEAEQEIAAIKPPTTDSSGGLYLAAAAFRKSIACCRTASAFNSNICPVR